VIFWPKTTPYSLDLAPCDFLLFPKLKRSMKGRKFATIEEIKITTSLEELKAMKSQKTHIRSASKIGKSAGTSV